MQQYLDVMRDILESGRVKGDRTGTGTKSVFGRQMRFDLQKGFPLVTTKKVHMKSIIYELLWFLRGETSVEWLNEHGITIWNEWAGENGELGPIYGYQWRKWPAVSVVSEAPGIHYEWEPEHLALQPIDQIAQVMSEIQTNPDSRRLVVSAWNVGDIDKMALQPCHILFQFNTRLLTTRERFALYSRAYEDDDDTLSPTKLWQKYPERNHHEILDIEKIPSRALDCQMYQRSCDFFLGVPFNIASYALLTMMVAQVTGCAPGEFVWVGGDVHLYLNHLAQAELQITREPRPLPRVRINPEKKSIDDFCFNDFTLEGYDPHPAIKAPIAV